MLSLSNMKDSTTVPSEEDRKKILTQMKVRTTLRSDKSWIQKKASDSEEEKNHSPLHSPLRSRTTSERSPISPKVSPLNHRAVFEELASQAEQQSPEANKPSKKSHNTASPTGYLIRGVFTKTVDKSAPSTPVPNGSPKSASLSRSAAGYKMSTEEYKKLAPYNVKRDLVPDHADLPVSPDEQLKRTEAASSVLRQTARRERSYVLSAAKKSHGIAEHDAPSFLAKRVEIEDDTGPRSRSQTMPASSWTTSHGKSTSEERKSTSGSPWSVQRMSNAASTTSIDTCSRSQAPKHYPDYSSAFNHFSSLENSNKSDQGKRSWEDSTPKVSVSPPKSSEKNEGKSWLTSGSEKQDADFSLGRSSFQYRTRDADASAEIHRRSKAGEYLNGSGADSARYAADHKEETFSSEIKYGSPSSRVTENQLVTAKQSTDSLPGERYSMPTPISQDQDIHLKSLEKKTTREETYKSPYETEYKKVEEQAHLATSGSWSGESSLSFAGNQTDLLRPTKSEELKTASSGSFSMENGAAPPESQQGERGGSDPDTSRYYSTSREGLIANSTRSHRMPFYKDSCEADSRRYLSGMDERAAFTSSLSTASSQFRSPSICGYESDPTTSSKPFLFVKESINSSELSSPCYTSRSLVDLPTQERPNYNSGSYMQNSSPRRPVEDICTSCGHEIRNCPKIKIEKLNICCHEFCFRCGICHKPMGDLLDKIFIHRDIVHCDRCYQKLF